MIITRDPKTLTPHPYNRDMPRIGPGMKEWVALYDDVRERGILEPLRIHGRHVIDGETRRQVAMAVGFTEVPCVEVPDLEILATVREKLITQKHLTKGQRAYLMVPLEARLVKEAEARRLATLKRGDSPGSPIAFPTQETFCEQNGFSNTLWRHAVALHGIFAGDKRVLRERNLEGVDAAALKEQWEPKILSLDAPIGLGAALAGIAGQVSTEGKAKNLNGPVQLALFAEGVESLDRVARQWPRLRHAERPEFIRTWARVAAGWPPDLREAMAEALLGGGGAADEEAASEEAA